MAATVAQFVPKAVQNSLLEFHKYATLSVERHWNMRERMRAIDLEYLSENDVTQEHIRAKQVNKQGNKDRLQNITVPVIKPQIAAAVAYQAGVFLTEYPIFGVTAPPQYIDPAKAFQAVLEENSIRGAWARHILNFFHDGFKYNISALEVCWKNTIVAAIDSDPTWKGGKEGKPKEIIWSGNSLERWDMYNTYWDTRVEPFLIPDEGEFAGHTQIMTRVGLKKFIASLTTKLVENIIPAFESPCLLNSVGGGNGADASYYIPIINSEALIRPEDLQQVDWMTWLGAGRKNRGIELDAKGLYEVSTEYVRIIPSDFGMKVPAPNTPQVWKVIYVNHSVPIYVERQTNAHEKIPVFFGSPGEDGLAYQSKSLATDAMPFQQVASGLMNATIAGRRRAITDRVAYDPSRVSEAHMNSPNPSAKIPMRPNAYGKPVSEAFYQFPYRDDQAGLNMQEIQAVLQMGNLLNGQNPARQGQFVKGNKTDSQWEGTMSNATSKDQLTALLYEAQVFTPVKEVLKINTLQYQQASSIYSPSMREEITVDPIALRQAVMTFKITDGLLPADKVISKDAIKVGMQVLGSSEILARGYNIAPLFSYIMKNENADLTPFEKSPQQVAYEQALSAWSRAATLALTKGAEFNAPQPLPQQFGFDPATVNPGAQTQAPQGQLQLGAQ